MEEAWGLGVKGTRPSSDQTSLAKQHLKVGSRNLACVLTGGGGGIKQPVKDVREK